MIQKQKDPIVFLTTMGCFGSSFVADQVLSHVRALHVVPFAMSLDCKPMS